MKQLMVKASHVVSDIGGKLPAYLLALVSRLAVATVFWKSAQTKISGWTFLDQHWQFFNLNDSTFTLFEYEYAIPLLPAEMAAYMATAAEFFLSLAVAFGLFTRLSALGLLGMTAVIQIFVYPEAWPTHIVWIVGMFYLIKHGPGRFSIDHIYMSSIR